MAQIVQKTQIICRCEKKAVPLHTISKIKTWYLTY